MVLAIVALSTSEIITVYYSETKTEGIKVIKLEPDSRGPILHYVETDYTDIDHIRSFMSYPIKKNPP